MPKTPDATGLYDEHGHWVLPVAGGEVTQVRVDFAFGLMIEAWLSIRIEGRFSLERGGMVHEYDPADTASLGPLVVLHKSVVSEALARKDGRLTIRFADGTILIVPPGDQYEAFVIDGALPPIQRKFTLVSLPGGGLTRM